MHQALGYYLNKINNSNTKKDNVNLGHEILGHLIKSANLNSNNVVDSASNLAKKLINKKATLIGLHNSLSQASALFRLPGAGTLTKYVVANLANKLIKQHAAAAKAALSLGSQKI